MAIRQIWTRRAAGARRTGGTAGSGETSQTRARVIAGYSAFFLAVLAVAFVWALPHERIVERALSELTRDQPVSLSFATARPRPPLGYRLDEVVVASSDDPRRLLELDRVTVSTPLLGALGLTNTMMDIDADVAGGTIDGTLARSDGTSAVHLVLEGIDLARATTALLPPPGRISGQLDLALDIAGDPARPRTGGEGTLVLALHNLSLAGLVARGLRLPDLSFDKIEVSAELHGMRLQVTSLEADGHQLAATLSGDVLLREPLERSLLNLRFDLKPGPTAPPGLSLLLKLLPRRADPARPWNLRGTPAAPSLG